MSESRLKFWGWGREDVVLSQAEIERLERAYAKRFGLSGYSVVPTPRAEDITLRKPRLEVPTALREVCSTDHYERLLHSYGKSFFDSVRVFARDFSNPPDVIAFPKDEQDIVRVLDWCDSNDAIAIPWGGGSSVVGGVEPPRDDRPVVTIDLKRVDRVLEIDETSQAARIQGGIYGPALEAALKPSGLTLRHFPQSFEFSTLGGWIATRSGGHYATLYTHIDEFVESLRVVTPTGALQSFRLPGSGAGPSPDRMFIGSEGTLGIITEAWMRLRKRPIHRASTSARFADFYRAAECVRAISQAHLYPANCRLLDADEAFVNGAGDGTHAVLVLTFESADRPQEPMLQRAIEIVHAHGGACDDGAAASENAQREGAAGVWRDAFIRMPYAREVLTPRAIIMETFETAITWDRFRDFHSRVKSVTEQAVREVTGKPGLVTCRFTHVYPDGPAPYFSIHAAGDAKRLLDQGWAIKTAASDVLNALGGTITHHHAVGRDHRRWYDRQRPDLFARAIGAAKKALDPKGMLNPGVLFDPVA
ncbi:MAG TPA: FAD-binding oxidoreductase [Burkholderiales bacterium]|nr:FAD-binding oxidoreductase [Burkholderiales bacterium]